MRKLKSLLFCFIFGVLAGIIISPTTKAVAADTTWQNDYEYQIYDEYLHINKYIGSETESITISTTATINGITYKTWIGFIDGGSGRYSPWDSIKNSLKSITLSGDGRVYFEGYSFYKLSQLQSIANSEKLTPDGVHRPYLYNAFYGCSSLQSLDVSAWNTGSVTTIRSAFYGCSSLQSLDVSKWDTSKVTDMGWAFYKCSSLQSLDVSNWDTSSVTNMCTAFYGCSSLQSLDVSKWDTGNVTNISSLFTSCKKLMSLDISKWDTHNVTNLSQTFFQCISLIELDVSKWDTSNVTNMYQAFWGCSSLQSLNVSSWDTSNVTNLGYVFYGCSSLQSLDVSKWDTSKVTNMYCTFYECSSLQTLDVSNWDISNVTTVRSAFYWCSSLQSLDVSKWDTSSVTNMYCAFYKCSSLTSLDVSKWDTSSVTDMHGVFYRCSSLRSLDVSKWNTSKVTDMWAAFCYCSSLQTLDVSKWDTSNVTAVFHAFVDCSSLTSLDLSNWDLSKLTVTEGVSNPAISMLSGCTSLMELWTPKNLSFESKLPKTMYDGEDNSYSTLPNSATSVHLTIAGPTTWQNDYEYDLTTDGYIYLKKYIGSATDDIYLPGIAVIKGKVYRTKIGFYSVIIDGYTKYVSPWYTIVDTLTNITLDPDNSICIRDQSFSRLSNLVQINNDSSISTTGITSLISTFARCSSLQSLDVSKWDTSKVTDMGGIFYECSSLQTLDVSRWDTSGVTNMGAAFYECSSLQSLDVSKWDTSKVTDMSYVFYGCSSLQSLDVSTWDTSKVTTMYCTFYGCSSLQSLDVSKWDTSKVTDMGWMFYGCPSLQTLDVSNWDTSDTTDMRYAFNECSSLQALDVSKWDTHNVTNLSHTFYGCSSLQSLDVSTWDTSNVTDMCGAFVMCSSLISLDISKWDTSKVTNMDGTFGCCSSLQSLDVSTWDTSEVTNMGAAFYECSSLTSLDVSKWDTSKVTTVSCAFYGCSSLTSLDLSNWDLSKLTAPEEAPNPAVSMLDGCTSLMELWTPKNLSFESELPKTMYDEEDNAYTILPNLDTSIYLSSMKDTTWQNDYEYDLTTDGYIYLKKYIGTATDDIYLPGIAVIKGKAYKTKIGYYSVIIGGYKQNVSPWYTIVDTLTSMTLDPDNSIWIRDYSFNRLSNLVQIKNDTSISTVGVTSLTSAFYECSSLQSLDVSTWDTSNVTDMGWVFYKCSSLQFLDVSKWNTGSVTNMRCMFRDCSSLQSLDVSKWDTNNVTNMYLAFYGCSSLQTLDVSNWDTSSVTDTYNMFYLCSSLQALDVSKWDTGSAGDISAMFGRCYSLTTLDVSKWDTSKVTNMNAMFFGCSSLQSLDVSKWNTSSVTTIRNMFYQCSSLTSLDLSNWDLSKLTVSGSVPNPADGILAYCTSLEELWTPKNLSFESSLPKTMYDEEDNSYSTLPDSETSIHLTIAGPTTWQNDYEYDLTTDGYIYLKKYIGSATDDIYLPGIAVINGKVYKTKIGCYSAMISSYYQYVSPWYTIVDSLTNITLDPDNSIWIGDHSLSRLSNLVQIKNDTSICTTDITSLTSAFSYCSSLQSLDVSKWNTSNVTDMGWMFDSCSSLQSLDTSKWDTSKVTNMVCIFHRCSSLKTLGTSEWDTSNVTNMGWMFGRCPSLQTLDVSKWDTSNVTNMCGAFYGCSSLQVLDVSKWDTHNVTNICQLFNGCTSLIELDVSKWDTSKVTDIGALFSNCKKLMSLDVSRWDTSNVTEMDWVFCYCSPLQSLDVSKWDTSKVTSMYCTFYGCSSLQSLDVSKWDTSSVTDIHNMFFHCSSLTSLDLSNWDLSNLTGTEEVPNPAVNMFTGCTSLEELWTPKNLSFESSLPKTMYDDEDNAYTILPNLDISIHLSAMKDTTWQNDYKYTLTSDGYITLTKYIGSATNDIYLPGIARISGQTYKTQISYYTYLFSSVSVWYPIRSTLTNITLDPDNLIWIGANSFNQLTKLQRINNDSSISTTGVTSLASTFSNCSSLKSINTYGWDVSSVTRVDYLFRGCSSLEELNLYDWDLSQVTKAGNMFTGCTSLVGMWAPKNLSASASLPCTMYSNQGISYTKMPNLSESIYLSIYEPTTWQNDYVYSLEDDGYIYLYKYIGSATDDIYLPGIAKAYGETFKTRVVSYNAEVDGHTQAVSVWYPIHDTLTKLTLDPDNPIYIDNAAFAGLFNLAQIENDTSIDVSAVNSLNNTLLGCQSLKSLDVSNWDTSHIEAMSTTFAGCSSLQALDVSNWDVSQMKVMVLPFYSCSSLQTLDVSKWDTSNLYYGYGLFYSCSSLQYLDVSKWDTSSLAYSLYMFIGCSSLQSLDVSEWNTANLCEAGAMFAMCPALQSLDLSNWDTVSLTNIVYMFRECTGLKSLDLSGWDLSGVTAGADLLTDCTSLEELWTPKNLSLEPELPHDMYDEGGTLHSSIPNSEESIYLSFFQTTTWQNDYEYDLTSDGYIYLKKYIGSATDDIYLPGIAHENGKRYRTKIGFYTDKTACSPWYPIASTLTTMTLDPDNPIQLQCFSFRNLENLKEIKNSSSTRTDCATLLTHTFAGCKSLVSLDVSKWDTSKVTSMYCAFDGCSSLQTLDVSKWDTSNVTDMNCAFWGCSSLQSLDVSKWDTSNVGSLEGTFSGCRSLTALDVSNWDVSHVHNLKSTFEYCTSLKTLDVSKWNTGNVETLLCTFRQCSSLEVVVGLSSWNTANVTTLQQLFYGCGSIISLDLSMWDTKNVTNLTDTFGECVSLSSLNVSGWNTKNVTSLGSTFFHCINLTSLDLSGWDISSVIYMNSTFMYCSKLQTLKLPSSTSGSLESLNATFLGCYSAAELPAENWNTSNVISMKGTFSKCYALESLDLSGWDVSNVTDMSDCFNACNSLQSLNVSNWDTSKVESTSSMFNGCRALLELDLSSWDLSNVVVTEEFPTPTDKMFDGCNQLEELWVPKNLSVETELPCGMYDRKKLLYQTIPDVESSIYLVSTIPWQWDYEYELTDDGYIRITKYIGDAADSLEVLGVAVDNHKSYITWISSYSEGDTQVSPWYTIKDNLVTLNLDSSRPVYVDSYAFSGLSKLSKIEHDTSIRLKSGTTLNGLFANCYALQALNVQGWDTSELTEMISVFSNCKSLAALDTSTWDLSQLKNIHGLFNGCSSLPVFSPIQWSIPGLVDISYAFANCPGMVGYIVQSDISNAECAFANSGLQIVEVWDGATKLPDAIFMDATKLQYLAFPSTLTQLGSQLVSGCNAIDTVYWNVKECTTDSSLSDSTIGTLLIGDAAEVLPNTMVKGSTIDTLDIGTNVTKIEPNALSDAKGISKIKWRAKNAACAREDSLAEYDLEELIFESTTEVIPKAFNKITVPELVLGEGIKEIKEDAFLEANIDKVIYKVPEAAGERFFAGSNMKELVITEGVSSLPTKCFQDSVYLSKLTLPKSLTSVGAEAFGNSAALTKVDWVPTNCTTAKNAFKGGGLQKFVVTDNVIHLPDILGGCAKLEEIEIGTGLKTFETQISSLTLQESTPAVKLVWKAVNCEAEVPFAECTDTFGIKITEVEIDNSVINIPKRFCDSLAELISVKIGTGVKSIGESAFANTKKLDKVEWNAIICETAEKVFTNSNLKTLEFVNGVQQIPAHVVDGIGLTTILFTDSIRLVGDEAFARTSNVKEVIWNVVNCEQAKDVFKDSGLQKITLSNDVKRIPESAFAYTGELQQVVLNTDLAFIGDCAFASSGVEKITWTPTNAKLISKAGEKNGIFSNSELTSFSTTETVIGLPDYLAANAKKLSVITLNSGLTNAGDYAFSNCSSITQVNWNPINCKAVKTFSGAGLQTVTFADTVCQLTGERTFENCTDLKDINLNENLTIISTEPFYGCSLVKSVKWVPASCMQYSEVGDTAVEHGKGLFNGTSLNELTVAQTVTKAPALLLDFTAVGNAATIGAIRWFAPNASLSLTSTSFLQKPVNSLTVGHTVISLPEYVFSNNSILNVQYESEGNGDQAYAFYKAMIQQFTFNGTARVPNRLANNGSIEKLVIPDTVSILANEAITSTVNAVDGDLSGVLYLGDRCLQNATILSANLSDAIEYIGDSALESSIINGLSIPAKAKYIGDYAFKNSTINTFNCEDVIYIGSEFANLQLDAIYLVSGSLKHVAPKAFSSSSLEEVEIDSTDYVISQDAFSKIDGLKTVWLKGDIAAFEPSVYTNKQGNEVNYWVFDSDYVRDSYAFDRTSIAYNELTALEVLK